MNILRIVSKMIGFARDEDGSATMWSLVMMILFIGIGGLAVDFSNGYRVKTGMASTADVTALAGAWELPEPYLGMNYADLDKGMIRQSAADFAWRNMKKQYHGNYIIADHDVDIGHWDAVNRKFIEGMDPPNAVHVGLSRNGERDNSVPTMMLRIAGLWKYDVNVKSVAMYGINSCIKNGLIAREGFYMAPGAEVLNNVCMHGQFRVDLQPGVEHMFPNNLTTGWTPADIVGIWDVKEGQIDMNTGQEIDMSKAQHQNLYPPMVDYVPTIARRMMRGELHYRHFAYPKITANLPTITQLPSNFRRITGTYDPPTADSGMIRHAETEGSVQVAGLGAGASLLQAIGLGSTGTVVGGVTARYGEVLQTGDQSWDWPLDEPHLDPANDGFITSSSGVGTGKEQAVEEKKIYFIQDCQSNKLHLDGLIQDVTIVTNCAIDISGSAVIENAVLFSTNSGSQSVQISNGARLGATNACESWGGVRVYSNGTIKSPSTGSSVDSQFWGVQLVARDDIHFSAQSDQSKGITMLAGGDIHITANARIGALDASELPPSPDEGCPPDGVHSNVFDKWAYEPVLVH